MIEIEVPDICFPEIEYTIGCLLNEFFGIDYKLSRNSQQSDFVFKIEDQSLVIKNHFFHTDDIERLYTIEKIPKEISSEKIDISGLSYKISSLFGISKLQKEGNQLILHADIISSTFFMLSRWEEWINPKRDNHGRFDGEEALAIKQGFFHRPIVNEYAELLYNLLKSIGLKEKRSDRKFKTVLTHDIDYIVKWKNFNSFKNELKKHINARQFFKIFSTFSSYGLTKIGIINDPFNNLVWLSKVAARKEIESIFYFMTGISNQKYDNVDYDLSSEKMQRIVSELLKNGSKIGVHPGYESYLSEEIIPLQVADISNSLNLEIQENRQHYLRLQIPKTLRTLDKSGIKYDSSLLYGKYIGFRNGVCYDFPIFDFLERKTLGIRERPLIFMENHHLKTKNDDFIGKFREVLNQVKKYNGIAVLLWHNSNMDNLYKRRMFARVLKEF